MDVVDVDDEDEKPSFSELKAIKDAKKKKKLERKKANAEAKAAAHYEKYWMLSELKYKTTRRNCVPAKWDTEATPCFRTMAKNGGIYLVPLRDRPSKSTRVKKGSVSSNTGNKYLHSDLKL